ncbi:hypothetical protein BH23ACT11_BH23ACT11_00720 [soil metagenome]
MSWRLVQLMFPWGGTPEEQMVSEIESELAVYKKRCDELHAGFRQRLRLRDDARTALAKAEERITAVRMEGVAMLGSLNSAMSEGNEDQVKNLERGYKRNNRDLVRTQKTRDAAERHLESVEVDDDEAVRDLKNDVTEVLEEYANRVQERKTRLSGFVELLDGNQEALARDTAPLTGNYAPQRAPEELSASENIPQED